MTNELTTAMVLSASHWVKPDPRLVQEKHRDDMTRRCAALDYVLQGASIRRAASLHRVNRTTLALIVDKAFRLESDGRPAGYRACLPYSVRTLNKSTAVTMPLSGNAHSLDRFFALHPDIKQMLDSHKGSLPPGRLPPDFKRLLTTIKGLLTKRECQSLWPMNTRDKGRRVFSRYVKRMRRQAIVDGAPSAPSAEMQTIARFDQLFVIRPFDRVEFDAHRIDVDWRISVPDARGELITTPISAIWILAIIEVASTAILGWKIVVGRSYSALDVAQCFASAMRRWEPRALIVPDLQYVPGAMMPSNLDLTTPVLMGRLTAMDNAKAHKAKLQLNTWLLAHYGVVNFGRPHVPEQRPNIEQLFFRLEEGAFRQIPGGFKPHRINQPATSTSAWSSNGHPLHFQALQDLMDVVVTGHNVSPIPGRQNRTPMEILSAYRHGDDFWMAPAYHESNAKALTTTCHEMLMKGSKTSNKPVHIQFLQVDYRHPDLDKAWEMVGQSYKTIVDLEDLRTITLVDESLRPIRTLHAASPWRKHRHDITTRRRILALSRSGDLEIRGADSAVAAYAAYTLTQAGKSVVAADQAARLIQLATYANDAPSENADQALDFYVRTTPINGGISFSDVEEF